MDPIPAHELGEDRNSPGGTSPARRWLDILPVGVFFVSGDGRVLFVNRTLVDLVPQASRSLRGQSYHTLFALIAERSRSSERIRQALQAAVISLPRSPEVEVEFAAHRDQVVCISFFDLQDKDNARAGWGGVIHDITRQGDRDQGHSRLLSRLAREIRKSLASIQGQWRALADHYQQWDPALVEDFYHTLDGHMQRVINRFDQISDLLQVQREGLVIYPEKVDLNQLLGDYRSTLSADYPELRLRVPDKPDLPPVRVDPQKIKRALRGIINYAAQRVPDGSEVEVIARGKGNWVEVSVVGQGIGWETAQQGTFFSWEEASQAHAQEELFIPRMIVQEHGGQMWFASPDDAGGEWGVHFQLPVMPIQRKFHLSGDHPDRDQQVSGSIVVADQDPESLNLISTVLKQRGYQVRAATDGPSAIDIVQATTPDLLILSWELAGMNGLNVSKYIRRWSRVPIFMVTSKTHPDHMLQAFEAGVDDYLTKPFLTDEVLMRTQALLRRSDPGGEISQSEVYEGGGLRVNFDSRRMWRDGSPIELTPIEYKLLTYMIEHQGRVLPYQQLMEHAWEAPDKGTKRGLFVHISRLRDKIEPDPDHPRFIVTRWGVGYVFMP